MNSRFLQNAIFIMFVLSLPCISLWALFWMKVECWSYVGGLSCVEAKIIRNLTISSGFFLFTVFVTTCIAQGRLPFSKSGESKIISEDIVPGSRWRHRNGNLYTVISIANADTENHEAYPVSVVYQGENGKIWVRRADDWHRSMRLFQDSESSVNQA